MTLMFNSGCVLFYVHRSWAAAQSLSKLYHMWRVLDSSVPLCLPSLVVPLNQYIHKEPQTLMTVIMLISSTLRCGFNISFRGTSLDSNKLLARGGFWSKHQWSTRTSRHTAFTVSVYVWDRDEHNIITKFIRMPEPFMHLSLHTQT